MTVEAKVKSEEQVGESEEDLAKDLVTMREFLSFTVNGEEYGVDIMKVREIKGWSDTTRLPNCPEFIKGVINLRGTVIPIFDLRGCFEMEMLEPTQKNVVIILSVGNRLIGILVDMVSDILSVPEDSVRPAPEMESKIDAEFVGGLIAVDEKMVVLLNIDNLFSDKTLNLVEMLSMGKIT